MNNVFLFISDLKINRLNLPLLLMLFFFSTSLSAGVNCNGGLTCTQTITLNPGWNSIYLQVKPDANKTQDVFASLLNGSGAQISSVWTWLSQRAQIEYIQDPDAESLLSSPGWLHYFPETDKRSLLTNLFSLHANRAYLVKLESTENVELVITGTPAVPRMKWSSNSFNLSGFHVNPDNKPTFKDFFAASTAHNEQPVYQLINNVWEQVDPLTTLIEPDVAYWVFSQGGSNYTGPLKIDLPQSRGLEYGDVLEQLTTRIKNSTNLAQTVSLKILGDAAGMYYPNPDLVATQRWLAFPQPLTLNLNVGEENRLALGIKRADFYLSEFEQILQITASGSRWLIPVKASSPSLNSLWVGSVSIDQVSQVQNYQRNCGADGTFNAGETEYELCLDANGFPISDDGSVMGAVSDEFSFRIILHRDTTPQVRLLKSVIQMWKDEVVDSDGIVITPGRYVLITDDSLIPDYKGIALRDGELVAKRISTMAYDFPGDTLDMVGNIEASDTLTATLNLESSAPTNPSKHHYHPDHNNLAIDYITENGEAFNVSRTMELVFDATSASGLGDGYNVKEGRYREVVTGLHKNPIIASGRFTLKHAASIHTLNQ